MELLRQELSCGLCLEFLVEPLSLGCGHSFCSTCLAQHWRGCPGDAPCPGCGEAAQPSCCQPNPLLGTLADLARQLSPPAKLCQQHHQPLLLYCQEDAALLCLVCQRSRLHRNHSVLPLEEAAQEYQERICVYLEDLRKRREMVLTYQTHTEMESQELLKLTERERQKTASEFRELHQLLDAEENRLLAQMEEVDKEIVRKREEHMARFSEELSSLDGIIQELEVKCQQMANDLLEDGGNIFRRCEQKEKFEIPVGFSPALKWRAWDFCDINSILVDVIHNFKASLRAEHPQRKANVFARRRLFHRCHRLMGPAYSRQPTKNPATSSCNVSIRNEFLGGRATQEKYLPTDSLLICPMKAWDKTIPPRLGAVPQ